MEFQLRAYHAPDFTKESFVKAPNARFVPAERDFVMPAGYHATAIFPEYFKVDGRWLLAEESRMDCVVVLENGRLYVREFRHVKAGDLVCVGRTENGEEGIFLHMDGFESPEEQSGQFQFRQGRSRETAFSRDYDQLCSLLEHEKRHGGRVVWVMGPACAFDLRTREAFCRLIRGGYVQAVLAGNALATHDLEGAYLRTALGQDIYTQESVHNGHYNHIDTINKVREYGSIETFVRGEKLEDSIIAQCVHSGVPFVLVGSVRDDGPLPEVFGNVYAGQDAMRTHVRRATTVIGMATTLHTIATGNMTPSFRVLPDGSLREVYFYSVDISEFAVNKLCDRGSLAAKSIVTNVQDFVSALADRLGL